MQYVQPAPMPMMMPAQPQIQYVTVEQKGNAGNNFVDCGCICCGSFLGGWATVMMCIAILINELWHIDNVDEHDQVAWWSDVTIHCHRADLSIHVWDFDTDDIDLDYADCTRKDDYGDYAGGDGLVINGDEYADCDVMGHVGRAWLAFCILSIMAGAVGIVAPCVSSNRWAARIGGGSLITAGVMAFLAVAWLNVGGDENFCAKHGHLTWSPIIALVFAFVFWGAAGIMLALGNQPENKTKTTVQIPVPITVPQAQLGLEMQRPQPVAMNRSSYAMQGPAEGAPTR